jgi:hypothetical protein
MGNLKLNTFSDFFKTKFVTERAYIQFHPSHFKKTYWEMAMPGVGEDKGDVIKTPVRLDQEDIDFLSQFPTKFQRSALSKRYSMLHDALLKLHDQRMGMGFKELEANLKRIISDSLNGNPSGWDELVGKMSPEVINKLKNKFNPENKHALGKTPDEVQKTIEDEANKEAYEEIKAKTERIPDTGPVEFKFGTNTYEADPYLNRLYHKIERTKGQEHDPSSGLKNFGMDKGEYGYDLAFPRKDVIKDEGGGKDKTSRITRGSGSWPNDTTSRDAMDDLWHLNHHQVFGDIKVPQNARYMPVKTDGKNVLKDDWMWRQTIEKYKKHFEKQLMNDAEKKFGTASEVNAEAGRMAQDAALKDVEEGKLVSPAIPTTNPDGTPVVNAAGQPLTPEDRKIRIVDGKLVFPDVYLPQVRKKLKKKTAGGTVEEEEWVPIMNPAHYYRELGKDEGDYVKGTGKLDIEKFKDRMTGIANAAGEKPYVKVDPEEYQKSGNFGHQAKASFHINQNSKGRFFISRGDEKYPEAYQKVFGDMKLRTDKFGAQLYDDFARGIILCAGGSHCGGAGATERLAILQNIAALHSIIVLHAMDNLGNPKLYEPKGRQSYANAFTGQFAQLNHGDGSRRQRTLDKNKKDVSRDKSVSGSEGGSLGIGDTLDAQATDKGDYAALKREKGGRYLQPLDASSWLSGGGYSASNVEYIRKATKEMQTQAAEADQLQKSVKITADSMDQLKNVVDSMSQVIDSIKGHLVGIYSVFNQNKDKEIVEKEVLDEIKGWISDGANTSEKLVAKFEAHPLVRKAMGLQPEPEQAQTQNQAPQAPTEQQPPSEEAQEVIDKFKTLPAFKSLKELQGTPSWKQIVAGLYPKPGENYSPAIAKIATEKLGDYIDPAQEEEILTSLQHFINNEFELYQKPAASTTPATTPAANTVQTPAQPSSVAARNITGARPPGANRTAGSENEDYYDLLDNDRWMDMIHHPEFHQEQHGPKRLDSLHGIVDKYHQNKWIDDAAHAAAKARIEKARELAQQKGTI